MKVLDVEFEEKEVSRLEIGIVQCKMKYDGSRLSAAKFQLQEQSTVVPKREVDGEVEEGSYLW